MTLIEFNLHDADTVDPDPDPSTAPSGFAYVQPFRDGLDVETYALLKTQREVTITDGVGEVEVDAAATQYWYVWFKITGYTTARHLFDVPTSGTVTYRDLRETYEVDPSTLVAVPAGAAWELADAAEEAARIAADGVLTAAVALKANAANPVFTGTVTVPDGALAQADVAGLVAALAAVTPGAWIALLDGTTNAKFTAGAGSTPQYRLVNGWVELAGLLTVNPAGVSAADIIATLPVGFRPPVTASIYSSQMYNATNGVFLRVTINDADGVVAVGTASATAASIYLDGIRWRV